MWPGVQIIVLYYVIITKLITYHPISYIIGCKFQYSFSFYTGTPYLQDLFSPRGSNLGPGVRDNVIEPSTGQRETADVQQGETGLAGDQLQ